MSSTLSLVSAVLLFDTISSLRSAKSRLETRLTKRSCELAMLASKLWTRISYVCRGNMIMDMCSALSFSRV